MDTSRFSPHTTHREVWMLLPWYVNGTLKGTEFRLVEEHLRVCITCHREVAEQQRLAEAIGCSGIMDLAPQASFARLMEHIARERSEVQRRQSGWRGLRPRWTRLLEWLAGMRLPRPAWVAVALLVVALVPATGWWLSSTPQAPQYHTLASPNTAPAAGSEQIRVVFAKTVAAEAIQQLLLSLHVEIVAGPSATGVYTIRLAASDPSNQNTVATLERLRHHPGVLLAEPMLPPSPGSRAMAGEGG